MKKQLVYTLLFLLASAVAIGGAQTGRPAARRIISIGPNVTETIYELGAEGRLVGVSDFCQYPPAAGKLPKVGGPANPRFETIAALQPDLIVMQFATEPIRNFAAARGIAVAEIHMDSIATIQRDILTLGRLLGREDAATSLTNSMSREIESLRKSAEAVPLEKRPLVFLSVERQAGSLAGILTASDRSFLGEALKLAGGRNAFGDLDRAYGEVSRESLVARRPAAILELIGHTIADPREVTQLKKDWEAMPSLPAVSSGRVRVIGGDDLLVPGPRLAKTIRAIHEAIE